ncbi:hypothetical protein Y032_0032g2549 [Ancylostoma ceylanicum]|uniref:Fatty acid hydroxylase domain-containing protein n=1 Tax=Ancylostoma ceylanicum TaxID=53326 RepID=A0A016UQV4_9BILA|nr:hypothetical protein Y032_0032g2549 [Ancylostoma ceylanicum]
MASIFNKLASDLNPHNLRYLFYLVTPNETTYNTVEEIPNILEPATTWMLILVVLEFLLLDEKKYAFNDTVTSINAGILSLLMKIGGRYLSAAFYAPLYERIHIVDLPKDSPYTWILCFFTQDLAYYLGHRAVHEAGVFWSFHQMHHSSEYYNLSTALRQGAVQDVATLFFDLLQALAIPPNIFVVHRYLNLIYQFWLHSNAIPYLGPLEYFINTPSSHRVHHGRNPYCIDRNYGGTLIIWDRLFGTYEAERRDEEIAYGLVTPVASFNQLWCQFFEFKALGYDKGQMRDENGKEIFPGLWNKIKAALWPPGYFPGVKTNYFFMWLYMDDNTEGIPKIEYPVVPYNPPLTTPLRCYLLVQWLILIVCSLQFDAHRQTLSWPYFLSNLAYLVSSLQMFGYYFDHSPMSVIFDFSRLAFATAMGLFTWDISFAIYGIASIAAVSLLRSTGNIIAVKKQK